MGGFPWPEATAGKAHWGADSVLGALKLAIMAYMLYRGVMEDSAGKMQPAHSRGQHELIEGQNGASRAI